MTLNELHTHLGELLEEHPELGDITPRVQGCDCDSDLYEVLVGGGGAVPTWVELTRMD